MYPLENKNSVWKVHPSRAYRKFIVYNIEYMKTKLVLSLLSIIFVTILYTPGLVKAQDTSDAFTQYSNPHAICDYYRNNGYVIERESDSECLISMGTGEFKTFTQYYYSGNNWCYKLIQEGKTYHENCIPIPNSTNTTEEYTPYIIVGVVIFVVLIVAGVSSNSAKSRALKTTTTKQPTEAEIEPEKEQGADEPDIKERKPKRSGKGSYGWEEMETSTTDTGEDTTKGPGVGQSQGGIGLHQGEPIASSVANDLEKLARLKEKGIISNKEFNIAKKKLLK